MIDLVRYISSLRRPRLLVRAARIGVSDYRRDRDLRRLMNTAHLPSHERAVTTLIDEEHALEETRKTGHGNYSPLRHVEILIALIAEARLLPRLTEIR